MAPTISSASASPNVLWPPNHQMIPVTVTPTATSGCGSVSCKIMSVRTNEPSGADAVAAGEAVITGNLALALRAERLGSGAGRVYTITVECTDTSRNTTTKTVSVIVPHDQGN